MFCCTAAAATAGGGTGRRFLIYIYSAACFQCVRRCSCVVTVCNCIAACCCIIFCLRCRCFCCIRCFCCSAQCCCDGCTTIVYTCNNAIFYSCYCFFITCPCYRVCYIVCFAVCFYDCFQCVCVTSADSCACFVQSNLVRYNVFVTFNLNCFIAVCYISIGRLIGESAAGDRDCSIRVCTFNNCTFSTTKATTRNIHNSRLTADISNRIIRTFKDTAGYSQCTKVNIITTTTVINTVGFFSCTACITCSFVGTTVDCCNIMILNSCLIEILECTVVNSQLCTVIIFNRIQPS